MEKEKWELIVSAGNKDDLQKCINKYYYSTGYIITDDNKIYNTIKEKFLGDNKRVIVKKNRWRYEILM